MNMHSQEGSSSVDAGLAGIPSVPASPLEGARVARERRATAVIDIGIGGVRGIPVGSVRALARQVAGTFNIWFWLVVVLPTFLAGIYFFGIASDLYMSEARFVVRTQSGGSSGNNIIAMIMHGGGSSSSDNSTVVQDFITSRAATALLERNNHLRVVFDRPEADFVTRFPNFMSGSTFEALYRHAQDYIDVVTNDDNNVTTLKVKAYRPEDAQAIARALVHYSEQLINELNQRAENDAVQFSLRDVRRAEDKLAQIEQQLMTFRFYQGIIDPKDTSSSIYDSLNQLEASRIDTETRLAELTKQAPNNPSIPDLKTRLASIERQIAQISTEMTGDTRSVAAKISDYERLTLARDDAAKEVTSTTESLESARIDVERQHLYVEHIAEPNLPDYPLYPRRLISFLIVLVVSLVVYGTAWLLVAGIREHGSA